MTTEEQSPQSKKKKFEGCPYDENDIVQICRNERKTPNSVPEVVCHTAQIKSISKSKLSLRKSFIIKLRPFEGSRGPGIRTHYPRKATDRWWIQEM